MDEAQPFGREVVRSPCLEFSKGDGESRSLSLRQMQTVTWWEMSVTPMKTGRVWAKRWKFRGYFTFL